jgi:hypothetical protein
MLVDDMQMDRDIVVSMTVPRHIIEARIHPKHGGITSNVTPRTAMSTNQAISPHVGHDSSIPSAHEHQGGVGDVPRAFGLYQIDILPPKFAEAWVAVLYRLAKAFPGLTETEDVLYSAQDAQGVRNSALVSGSIAGLFERILLPVVSHIPHHGGITPLPPPQAPKKIVIAAVADNGDSSSTNDGGHLRAGEGVYNPNPRTRRPLIITSAPQ